MSGGFLLYVAVVITLAAAGGWAVESLSRQFARPARWAWLIASVMALVLVLQAAFATSVVRAVATYSPVALPEAGKAAAPEWSMLQTVREAIAISTAAVTSLTDSIVRAVPSVATDAAVVVWAVTSLVALVGLAFVHLRIRRARRDWAQAELFGTRVYIAPNVGPAVVGLARPQIVVPSWLLGRSTDEQQLVLAHEREHLSARDHLLLGAGSLVVALVPWHPAAWWMLARLRLAIELDCDARVLRMGVAARTYGTLLVDLADRCTGFRVGATALADEGSHLERRLLAMKTNKTKRSLLRAGMLGSAAALALFAACEAKVPTGPEIQAMDVASVERAATQAQLFKSIQADTVTYYIDGKRVDPATAHALNPTQIAVVGINETGAPARKTVYITTRAHATGVPVKSESVKVRMSATGTQIESSRAQPLILIDGVKATDAQLKALDRDRIASINVYKGATALSKSPDPAAQNGIIEVTTKK